MPASCRAAKAASPPISRMDFSHCSSTGVCPIPRIATSRIHASQGKLMKLYTHVLSGTIGVSGTKSHAVSSFEQYQTGENHVTFPHHFIARSCPVRLRNARSHPGGRCVVYSTRLLRRKLEPEIRPVRRLYRSEPDHGGS